MNNVITEDKIPYKHHYMFYGAMVNLSDGQPDKIWSVEYINDYTEIEIISYCPECGNSPSVILPHDGSNARPQPEVGQ